MLDLIAGSLMGGWEDEFKSPQGRFSQKVVLVVPGVSHWHSVVMVVSMLLGQSHPTAREILGGLGTIFCWLVAFFVLNVVLLAYIRAQKADVANLAWVAEEFDRELVSEDEDEDEDDE